MSTTMRLFTIKPGFYSVCPRARHFHKRYVRLRSEPEDSESTESLFAKELKKRGITPESLQQSSRFSRKTVPVEEARYEADTTIGTEDRFQKARALSSEGLEGLIPRAKELLTLGGTFTLSFLPAIILLATFTGALYLVFGESFIHYGSPELKPPSYIEPYELLSYPYND